MAKWKRLFYVFGHIEAVLQEYREELKAPMDEVLGKLATLVTGLNH